MAKTKHLINELPFWFTQRVESRLQFLYGAEQADGLMDRLYECLQRFAGQGGSNKDCLWDERDVIMISYGDNIRQANEKTLKALFSL